MEILATAGSSAPVSTNRPSSHDQDSHSRKWIGFAFWCGVIVLGGLQFWINRYAMNTDGISYLDIADAISKGHLSAAANAYWSPLYPCLLALGLAVFRPSPYWEFPVVHLVNFLILLAAAVSFQFFIGQLLRVMEEQEEARAVEKLSRRGPVLLAIGSTLFIWTSLKLAGLEVVSPDLLLTVFVYLASGLTLRMKLRETGYRDFALLGFLLGIGYLAKTPMLPLGLVFLAVGIGAAFEFLQSGTKGFASREKLVALVSKGAVAIALFVAAATPFVIKISMAKGRFTIGDSARLNIAWNIDGVTRHHWQGKEGFGVARHPSVELMANPQVFEFDGPMISTYAAWYDPSYWYEGIHPVLKIDRMAGQLRANAYIFYKVLVRWELAIPILFFLLALLTGRPTEIFDGVLQQWALLVPVAAALMMYGVLYAEPRYLPSFVVLFWLGLFAGLRIPEDKKSKTVAGAATGMAACIMVIFTATAVFGSANPTDWKNPFKWKGAQIQYDIAQALHQDGIEEGDKVAWIRPEIFDDEKNYAWARLARVRIIAEVPGTAEKNFWAGGQESLEKVVRALRQTDARALIAKIPEGVSAQDWQPLGNTGYSIIVLQQSRTGSSPKRQSASS
jgi:hypothetical protein